MQHTFQSARITTCIYRAEDCACNQSVRNLLARANAYQAGIMLTTQSTEKTAKNEDQTPAGHKQVTIDGNEAAAYVAYRASELVAIYPITPSSPMAELADDWAAAGKTNLWGDIPLIQEMQSEGGAAGAAHGGLQAGALTTSFTASQGLLLMIPVMFKVAGELTSTVFHITARSLATHALSIFCDHGDVMATRSTGWGMLFSNSVQEVHDLALIAHASTLSTRIPFLHIFDGFRTSHEVSKIAQLSDQEIRALIDDDLVRAHRSRGLSPDQPILRGTAQNPDVFFQSRERANKYFDEAPAKVQAAMDKFAEVVGRRYNLFDYVGAPDAERVVVMMGSGAETVEETVKWLCEKGEKVGLIKVRLFRPFSVEHFRKAIPATTKILAVLDRTKEPGASGEPLLQDVVTSIYEDRSDLRVIGGKYGLGSKEFTPAMVKAIYDEMGRAEPRRRFTVGIVDDVTKLSLEYDEHFHLEPDKVVRAVFWGLGSDGTVGANKNSIKIIGEETDNHAQGYFVYDSKKSGSVTVSHLRFGPEPIHSPYLISSANFVAIHQFGFLDRFPVLDSAVNGATVLINSPYSAEETWHNLLPDVQRQILQKKLKVFVLDGYEVAKQTGMGNRINTIMQVGFFALCGVLPREEAIERIKLAIKKSYGKFGEPVVRQNNAAVDAALGHLHQMVIPAGATAPEAGAPKAEAKATACTCECAEHAHDGGISTDTIIEMIAGRGDLLPVSAMPDDGTFPTGTAALEKRNIALEVPVWDPSVCIQCGKCVLVCPHAVIRSTVADADSLAGAPDGFKTAKATFKDLPGKQFTIQVSVEDCTGCAVCVDVCPAKNKAQVGRKAINMESIAPIKEQEIKNWNFFLSLPDSGRYENVAYNSVKNVQLLQPLFEFSGACAGCGETPYVKLVSQMFGDRTIVANATGCSSIYGGNLPATPWTKNAEGRGPAWSNSLFEDNAEFGLGMRLAVDLQQSSARRLLKELSGEVGGDLAAEILGSAPDGSAKLSALREKVAELKSRLGTMDDTRAKDLLSVADALVDRSVWIIGGDGWAYDIGYGGLDHVLASGANVNILVLDTEVYSNTGGQMSKSTSRGAVAKFAAGGKPTAKKDLGRLAMNYGNVYVASIAAGASDTQTVKAFVEAESYPGTSLIIAYSHCIAHGINMSKGMNQQKLAVQSGHWTLYRYDPRLAATGANPFQLDSGEPTLPLEDYYYSEARYRMLKQSNPAAAEKLLAEARQDVANQWRIYKAMATPQGSV